MGTSNLSFWNGNWRLAHDYYGDNHKQTCHKCGRILYSKDQNFPPSREWTDDQPQCIVKDKRSVKQLLLEEHWMGFGKDMRFYVDYKPFGVLEVKLTSLVV